MPNWCNNSFTIQGSTETVKTLWEDAHSGENGAYTGLLQAMVPMPEILEDTTSPTPEDLDEVQLNTMLAQTGASNWYDWRVGKWGTKWDVGDEGLEFIDNGDGTAAITGWFDSAWAPPVDAFQTWSTDMDGAFAELYYDEPGMCFVGYWSSEGGDDYYEYSDYSSENISDNIPEYLVDYFDLEERLAEYEEWEREDA